jgi:HPt (histidine-containing phosphotransfer) domain-containing protein
MLMNSMEIDTPAARQGSGTEQINPVDLQHLRRYTMGDIKLEKEVLELFLGQLPVTIKALSEATSERDWQIAAHTLKGSGSAVGAWRVARLAEHAERPATIKNAALRSQAIARIEEAAEEARAFIRSAYPNAS